MVRLSPSLTGLRGWRRHQPGARQRVVPELALRVKAAQQRPRRRPSPASGRSASTAPGLNGASTASGGRNQSQLQA